MIARILTRPSLCFAFLAFVLIVQASAQTDSDAVPPVRVGDQVEVQSGFSWYPATVTSYSAGTVSVDYQWNSIARSGDFALDKTRFPNGEGHWMVWKDKTGKFSTTARYLSRTEKAVQIRKVDGSETSIPIDQLLPSIRRQVLSVPVTGNENMIDGANPVRVGDNIEIEYFGKWYPAVVNKVLPGEVEATYQRHNSDTTKTFPLAEIRFPNGEGRWRLWSDASGNFKIVARYISRTNDKVTIRKEDGSDVSIAIDQLSAQLRALLAKTPVTGEENAIDGVNPVRVGDQIRVKHWFRWYTAIVTKVLPGELDAKFDVRGKETTERFKLADIRFANGEGRWRMWSDASGSFKIVARFISRDDTHVTIRREDGSDINVEIAKLNSGLRKLLSETPIITARPRNVVFKPAAKTIEPVANSPDLKDVVITVPAVVHPNLKTGGTGFALGKSNSISAAIPIGGASQWVGVGVFTSSSNRNGGETKLYWASLQSGTVTEGPSFLDDERIVDYSAAQSRVLSVQVGGYYGQPIRFCTYRVSPGESAARPEASWAIPESKGSFGRQSTYLAKLIGTRRLLLANNNSISLYDFSTREVVYSISKAEGNRFYLHPGEQHFAMMDNTGGVALFELESGRQLAYRASGSRSWGSGLGYSQDGRHLLHVSSSGMNVWNLTQGGDPIALRTGGLSVGPSTPISILDGGWISAGSQIYSTGLKLVAWNYVGSGVSITQRRMLGRQMFIAGTAYVDGKSSALVGVATVPHDDAIELMKKVDADSIVMLKPGVGVRIESGGDSRIVQGLRRAVAERGFREDPTSEIILSGTAGPGKSETRTYQMTSFGSFGGSSTEEHTVTPWEQRVNVRYRDKPAWSTGYGGVPGFISVQEGSSLGAELQKSSQPKYDLFEHFKLPEELLYPRYQRGLGTTQITVNGFVDKAN